MARKRKTAVIALIPLLVLLGACAQGRVLPFNPRGLNVVHEYSTMIESLLITYSLEDTINSAAHVVIGEAVETYGFIVDPSIYTLSRIRIDRCLKGDLSGDILVVTQGGYASEDLRHKPRRLDPLEGKYASYLYYFNHYSLAIEDGGQYLFALGDAVSGEKSYEKLVGGPYYTLSRIPYGSMLLNGDGKAYVNDLALRNDPRVVNSWIDPDVIATKKLLRDVEKIIASE